MCGIVGLHLRDPDLHPQLGALLSGMLTALGERGPDAAGVAVYGDPVWTPPGTSCVSVLTQRGPDELQAAIVAETGCEPSVLHVGGTTLIRAAIDPATLRAAVHAVAPEALLIGFGEDVAVLKGIGRPADLAAGWGLAGAQGRQGVGHTRMATESAVVPEGSHPYAVGPDQCMVHNGSFANHATIRRELRARGVEFDSENDTEVGARFVAQCLADGLDVETALKELCARFDGFYTLLVADRDSFAVVRDAIACKPAVIAETDAWVAMGSEYRALVGLPGIEGARIYEPDPERVYAWTH
ncbi:glutamine amidotransferase [Spongisporangium articulatum]|uniref:glutamine--fructose-6-phosphate transaminase (isomerizing) n=1 Tax=Spongisporangium articulatum TaxID=3362603 RepID=A0ABW8AUK2_9ACTN